MSPGVLVAQFVRTRTHASPPRSRSSLKGALVIRVAQSRVALHSTHTGHRAACSTAQHLIARISHAAKPTNISRHHCLLLSSSFSSVTTPNNYTTSVTQTSPFPTLTIHPSIIVLHPRLPVPDTPSCDSTTARLTTPTLPLQPITSISPVCQPPAVLTRCSTSLRLHSPPPYTSYQPSHLSNRPPTSQGPQQQQQPAIATSLYHTPNDTQNTTYARIEIAEFVENPIADATTNCAASR